VERGRGRSEMVYRVFPAAIMLASVPVYGQTPRVVHYGEGAKPPARWVVAPKPLLEIGGADAEGPAEFTKIALVARQRDGSIIVANGATNELRVFDQRGRFIRNAARSGKGPGEISNLDRAFAIDDTIVVSDDRFKLHVFAPNGKWTRSYVVSPIPNYVINPLIGAMSATSVVFALRKGEIKRLESVRFDSLWFARVGVLDSTVRHLAAERLAPTYGVDPGFPPIYDLGFAPRTLASVTRGRMCVGYPERYEVTCIDSLGRTIFELSRDTRRRAVSDSAKRAFRFERSGRRPDGTSIYEGSLRQHRERVADLAKFAAFYPAYAQLMFSRTGDLWVRDFQTYDGIQRGNAMLAGPAASTWSIYDTAGTWIADCTLPPRFAATEIGADYVIGISRDEDDVERVTLLSLRK
jgi:hypothetical protein